MRLNIFQTQVVLLLVTTPSKFQFFVTIFAQSTTPINEVFLEPFYFFSVDIFEEAISKGQFAVLLELYNYPGTLLPGNISSRCQINIDLFDQPVARGKIGSCEMEKSLLICELQAG